MRSRLYDPEHGRFLSRDPLLYEGSPTNPYAYGNNNPLFYKDPSGRIPVILVAAFAKGIFSSGWYFFQAGDEWTVRGLAASFVDGFVRGATGTFGMEISVLGGYIASYLQSLIADSEFEPTNTVTSKGSFNTPEHKFLELKNPFNEAGLSEEKAIDYLLDVVLHYLGLLIDDNERKTTTGPYDIEWEATRDSHDIDWRRSLDPNDILGPAPVDVM